MVFRMLKQDISSMRIPLLIVADICMISAMFASFLFPYIYIISGFVLVIMSFDRDHKAGRWEPSEELNKHPGRLVLEKYLFVLLIFMGQILIYVAGFLTMVFFLGRIPRVPYNYILLASIWQLYFLGIYLFFCFRSGPLVSKKLVIHVFIGSIIAFGLLYSFDTLVSLVVSFFIGEKVHEGFFAQSFPTYLSDIPENRHSFSFIWQSVMMNGFVLVPVIFIVSLLVSLRRIKHFDFATLKDRRKHALPTIAFPNSMHWSHRPAQIQPLSDETKEVGPFEIDGQKIETTKDDNVREKSKMKHPYIEKLSIAVIFLYLAFTVFVIAFYTQPWKSPTLDGNYYHNGEHYINTELEPDEFAFESDTRVGVTSNRFGSVYSIEGDESHNYLVVEYPWPQNTSYLYVKESSAEQMGKGPVTGIFCIDLQNLDFKESDKTFTADESFINTITSLELNAGKATLFTIYSEKYMLSYYSFFIGYYRDMSEDDYSSENEVDSYYGIGYCYNNIRLSTSLYNAPSVIQFNEDVWISGSKYVSDVWIFGSSYAFDDRIQRAGIILDDPESISILASVLD